MVCAMSAHNAILVSENCFRAMLRFALIMQKLSANPDYARVLEPRLPASARYDPGYASILMGYDFHLSSKGPQLIEINNNAGGLYLGEGRWLPQPDIPPLQGKLEDRLLAMFSPRWQTIAIMDEEVEQQFMYPEMLAYARLLESDGRKCFVLSPERLQAVDGGLAVNGEIVHAIYNRHTDFYLEDSSLAHVLRAYLDGAVALTPHPRSYGLLGDKQRMVDWKKPGFLERFLDEEDASFVRRMIPETRLLADMDRDRLWRERRRWYFKPASRHGGKGVMPGKMLGKKRFRLMDAQSTIVQEQVPAPEIELGGKRFRYDIRLVMHEDRLIALAARIWQGEVLNFRLPGSGFMPVQIVPA